MTVAVDIVRLPVARVAFVASRVRFTEMGPAQREAKRLLDVALPVGIEPCRLTIWRMRDDGLVDYAPGVILPAGVELMPADRIGVVTLPDADAAHRTIHEPYERLASGWSAFFEACRLAGFEAKGPNIEVYADPSRDPPVTELYAVADAFDVGPPA